MGKVYLANASTTWAKYVLNDGPLPPGRPVAAGPQPPPYTPYFLVAPLDRYPDSGQLGYGVNSLVVTFQDTDPPDRPHAFKLDVPMTHSIDDPLILYALRGAVMLLTARGVPLGTNPQIVLGAPIT